MEKSLKIGIDKKIVSELATVIELSKSEYNNERTLRELYPLNPNVCDEFLKEAYNHEKYFGAINYFLSKRFELYTDFQHIGFSLEYDHDKEYERPNEISIIFLFWKFYFRWKIEFKKPIPRFK